jgi:hypothetical protein
VAGVVRGSVRHAVRHYGVTDVLIPSSAQHETELRHHHIGPPHQPGRAVKRWVRNILS